MDIGVAIDRLMPGADFGRCDTYEALVATWRDVRTPPTLGQLQAAWDAYLTEGRQLRAALRARIQSAVGKTVDTLTTAERNALIVALLYKVGALDAGLHILPPRAWLVADE